EHAIAHRAATLYEVFEQTRAVDAHVNAYGWLIEDAGEGQRMFAGEVEGIVRQRHPGGVPMGDPELTLALTGGRRSDDDIMQAAGSYLLRGVLGEDRGLDASLLQQQAKMQTRDSGADDADLWHALCHAASLRMCPICETIPRSSQPDGAQRTVRHS